MSRYTSARTVGAALLFTALPLGGTAIAMTGMGTAMAAPTSTVIEPSELTAAMSAPVGSTQPHSFAFGLTLKWDVPNGTSAGATTPITLPNYLTGQAVQNLPIADTDGNKIGEITGSGTSYKVTYTDYATTHSATSVSVTIPVQPNNANWPTDTNKEITATVGGQTADAGSLGIGGSTSLGYSYNLFQNSVGSRDAFTTVGFTPALVNNTAIGVEQYVTYSVASTPGYDTTKYLQVNCDEVNAGANISYTLLDPYNQNSPVGPYNTDGSGAGNPMGLHVVSCTPTTLKLAFTTPDQARSQYAIQPTLINTKNGVGLFTATQAAEDEKYVGPYVIQADTSTTGSGTAGTFASYGYFAFPAASGSGTVNVTPSSPTSTSTTPVPTSTTPVPTSTSTTPVPTSTTPVPTSTSTTPVPTSTSTTPVPTSTTPVPTSTTSAPSSTTKTTSSSTHSAPVSSNVTTTPASSVGPKVQTDHSGTANDSLVLEMAGTIVLLSAAGAAAAVRARRQ